MRETTEHSADDCPYDSVDEFAQPRLDRSNHYFHDSLGCPFECTGRHNHPVQR